MRDDKVQCQCCGKWMVPRPIFSRGIWSNGWRVGGGRVIGSICPFCLDEDWDGVERVHRGVLFKTVALAISVFLGYVFVLISVIPVSFLDEQFAMKESKTWLFGAFVQILNHIVEQGDTLGDWVIQAGREAKRMQDVRFARLIHFPSVSLECSMQSEFDQG